MRQRVEQLEDELRHAETECAGLREDLALLNENYKHVRRLYMEMAQLRSDLEVSFRRDLAQAARRALDAAENSVEREMETWLHSKLPDLLDKLQAMRLQVPPARVKRRVR